MKKDGNKNISRKQAIKQLGGLALGGTGLISSMKILSKGSKPNFPNIITKRASQKPNVLWITSEGTPISVLSCYQDNRWGDLRSSLVDTPNIGRIAHEGMRFQNSFCTNALCAPSRATLLTGKYSHENGVLSNDNENHSGHPTANRFDTSQQTFPKVFRQHGYRTAIMGKWHLHSSKDPSKPANPAEAGFDKFAIKRGAGGPYYNPRGYLQNPHIGSSVIERKTHSGYITDNFTDMALQTMKQFNSEGKPFMMMMQFFNDHRPFDPPHKYADIYKDQRIPEPSTFWDEYKHRSTAAKEARMRVEYMPDFNPPKDLTGRQRKQYNYQKFLKRFLGTYKSQDDNVGRLLHYLDQAGLAENTIVVYTSDHGFFLGDHGWLDKRFMYEEALRVPWMIRYPGMVEPGTTTDLMGVNIDNAPTILDLANLPIPGVMQGRSLKPILRGETPSDWRTSMYYHYYEFVSNHFVLPNYGVRTDRYKLINYYSENQWELFDLGKDPDEMDSLFEWGGYKVNPEYKEITQHLVNELKQLRKKYNDTTGRSVKMFPTRFYD
ncbi:MAG TPA: sulfatase [Balneolales bacterium]|nr:sulfatase [Balneolales bacterium]